MSMPLYLEKLCKTVAQKAEPHARDAVSYTHLDVYKRQVKGSIPMVHPCDQP